MGKLARFIYYHTHGDIETEPEEPEEEEEEEEGD